MDIEKRSDCPYPEVVCSEIHDATTFEHYQCTTVRVLHDHP